MTSILYRFPKKEAVPSIPAKSRNITGFLSQNDGQYRIFGKTSGYLTRGKKSLALASLSFLAGIASSYKRSFRSSLILASRYVQGRRSALFRHVSVRHSPSGVTSVGGGFFFTGVFLLSRRHATDPREFRVRTRADAARSRYSGRMQIAPEKVTRGCCMSWRKSSAGRLLTAAVSRRFAIGARRLASDCTSDVTAIIADYRRSGCTVSKYTPGERERDSARAEGPAWRLIKNGKEPATTGCGTRCHVTPFARDRQRDFTGAAYVYA